MEIGRPTEIVYASSKHLFRTILIVIVSVIGILGVLAAAALISMIRGGSLSEWLMPAAILVGVLIFAVIALAAASVFSRATESANIQRVLSGPHWAAWQYTPAEWQAYAAQVRQSQDAQVNQSMWGLIGMAVGLVMLLVIGGGMMAWLLFGIPPETRAVIRPMLFIIPIVIVGTAVMIVVSSLNARGQMRRMVAQSYAAMMRVSSPRMYFTGDGLYREDSGYIPLNYLTDAEYLAQAAPPAIRIKSWQRSGRAMYQSEMIIPVPHGSEQAAALLIERYRRERLAK